MAVAPDQTWKMEQFAKSYVGAVASSVGCKIDSPLVDDDSVDIHLTKRELSGRVRSPQLDAQLKTTYQDVIRDSHVFYDLERKNYDDLRPINLAVPRILIVVLVPGEIDDWLMHSEKELALRHCGYWISLFGKDEIKTNSKRIEIPRAQQFNVSSLSNIFARLSDGQKP